MHIWIASGSMDFAQIRHLWRMKLVRQAPIFGQKQDRLILAVLCISQKTNSDRFMELSVRRFDD